MNAEPPTSVTVTTGARLHFGLMSLAPHWGGVGAMIGEPRTVVRAAPADQTEVVAPFRHRDRLAKVAAPFLPAGAAVRLELLAAPPPHAGFGSGTQRAMATAAAVSRLFGRVFERGDAAGTGRGRRSRLGMTGFFTGGLLYDAGHGGGPVRSVRIPADWRAVLVTPADGAAVAGEQEGAALAHLTPYPPDLADRLGRLGTRDLPRAVREQDLSTFVRLLGEYGTLVGRHFAPLQGGVYASPAVRRWADRRRSRGAGVPVQSSWGPSACVVCRASEADGVAEEAREACGPAVRVVPFSNAGATVRVDHAEPPRP